MRNLSVLIILVFFQVKLNAQSDNNSWVIKNSYSDIYLFYKLLESELNALDFDPDESTLYVFSPFYYEDEEKFSKTFGLIIDQKLLKPVSLLDFVYKNIDKNLFIVELKYVERSVDWYIIEIDIYQINPDQAKLVLSVRYKVDVLENTILNHGIRIEPVFSWQECN